MEKTTAKEVLSAYRRDRLDAGDPSFAAALREVARDPELKAWFEDAQRFDLNVRQALLRSPIPSDLKDRLLEAARSGESRSRLAGLVRPRVNWRNRALPWLAAAACVLLAFVLGRQTRPREAPQPRVAADRGVDHRDLSLQAISYTSQMPALQFVCFSSPAVAKWIDRKSAEMKMGTVIAKPLATMQMIGSSAMQWDGKPVIMVALQNGDRMAMLYFVRESDFPAAASEVGRLTEKDGWVSKAGRSGEHLYVLTAKGTRDDLNFPMPF